MNRKKKVIQILKKKVKKANAKKNPTSTKPSYISKAERAKLAAQDLELEGSTDASSAESTKP